MRRLELLALVVLFGCNGNGADPIRPADAGSPDAPLGAVADAPLEESDAASPPVQAMCETSSGPVVCQCSDGTDNDDDGKADAADPECTGPYDNDESSYATGIPGDNRARFVHDCFFDGDSGSGNDGCRWDIRCTDPPSGTNCNNNQLEGCDTCRPLVPNGCDCFGCCDVFVEGVAHTVRILEDCTAENIDDPEKCPPCTKVAACENPCDPCEVCIGRPEPDPSCMGDGDAGTGGGQCPVNIVPCPPPDFHCSQEERCITGCCQPFLD